MKILTWTLYPMKVTSHVKDMDFWLALGGISDDAFLIHTLTFLLQSHCKSFNDHVESHMCTYTLKTVSIERMESCCL